MLTITYLNDAKQTFTVSYDSYADYERAQLACLTNLADHYRVSEVTYNGHKLDYTGRMGDLYFYLMKLDRTAYE